MSVSQCCCSVALLLLVGMWLTTPAEAPLPQAAEVHKLGATLRGSDCSAAGIETGDPRHGPSIIVEKFTPGCAIPWHWHTPNEHVMMVSGAFHFEIRGEKPVEVNAGDFVLIPSHHVSQTTCVGPDSCVDFLYTDAAADMHFVDHGGAEISYDQALKDYGKTLVQNAVQVIAEIQRADYAGDRAALVQLHGQLPASANDPKLAARLVYWRGFALWRRAINGFNDGTARPELRADLENGLAEFNEAADKDPQFADAKVGALGCLSLIGYLLVEDGVQIQDARVQDLFGKMGKLRQQAAALDPDNPRLLWVLGPNVWKSPPERGGGEVNALAMYERGLATARRTNRPADPLEPAWGEPELLMSLAYTKLNGAKPDAVAAKQYAEAALKLVPNWHYVRDILLPQIRQATTKSNSRVN